MKKILLISLCSMHMLHSMFPRVPLSMQRITNQQRPYSTTNANFGKKHFIVGYPQTQQDAPSQQKNTIVSPIKKDKNPSTVSFFTSTHDVRKELDACLQEAKETIYIAAFALTDGKIAEQLIRAQQLGIKIIIVTDKEKMKEQYSKINTLANKNIPVHYYAPELNPNQRQKRAKNALMHHKFIIIDDTTLIFGSLNLTKSGQEENMENITVTIKQQMVQAYKEEFERLLKLSKKVEI